MNWEDFLPSIKTGKIQNLYLFTGPEEWTKREAVAALREALLPPGLEQLNETVLDNPEAQRIIDCAETLPVMCARRLVLVRDWAVLTGGRGGEKSADFLRILEWAKNAPDSCTVVFYLSEVYGDKSTKPMSELEKCAEKIVFGPLSNPALLKWCGAQLRPLGKRIAAPAVNEMALMIGGGLTRMNAELEKLSSYIGKRAEIEVADVRAIVTPSIEYKVYLIMDNLLSGDLAKAVAATNSALQGSNAASLISLLLTQMRRNLYIKYVQDGRTDEADAIADLKLDRRSASYVIRQTKRQVSRFDAELLKKCYLACVDSDYAVKSGMLKDRLALDALLLQISQLATAGRERASN